MGSSSVRSRTVWAAEVDEYQKIVRSVPRVWNTNKRRALLDATADLCQRLELARRCQEDARSRYVRRELCTLIEGFAQQERWMLDRLRGEPLGPFRLDEARARIRLLGHLMEATVAELTQSFLVDRNEREWLLHDMKLFCGKYYGILTQTPALRAGVAPRSPQDINPLIWYVRFVLKDPSEPLVCSHCSQATYGQLPYCAHCFEPQGRDKRRS